MNDMQARIEQWLTELDATKIRPLVDEHAAGYFHEVLHCIHAHEGSIWVRPPKADYLMIAYNDGPRPAELEGQVKMKVGEGLISKAYNEHITVCHQGMFRHKDQSEHVDKQLRQLTAHQIAAPFYFFGTCCGVLSAIQTYSGGVTAHTKWGFDRECIQQFTTCANVLRRLLEYQLLKQELNLKS